MPFRKPRQTAAIIVAIFALDALSIRAAAACNSNTLPPMSSAVPAPLTGMVTGFLTPKVAQMLMQANEQRFGRMLDSAYTDNTRAVLQMPDGSKTVALVPAGMSVRPGDMATFIPYHADPHNLCDYLPPLIRAVRRDQAATTLSTPPIYGRSTSGTVMEPSSFW